jgi:hypothetical protein
LDLETYQQWEINTSEDNNTPNMATDWAASIGNCGICPKAAKGGCAAVNALADAAKIPKNDAQASIQGRIDAANDAGTDDAAPGTL